MTCQANVRFVLDANVFIEAHRNYYSFEFCPAFWDCLTQHFHNANLLSIDKVRAELLDISKLEHEEPDTLYHWTLASPTGMFVSSSDQALADAYNEIIAWVSSRSQFFEGAKEDFAAKADGWLVAYAHVHGRTLVTQEVPDPRIKKRVPIPNVCQRFNVPYLNTFDMLRKLGVRFELASTAQSH